MKSNIMVLAAALTAIAGSASALTITSAEGECAADPALSGCSSDASRLDLGNVGLADTGDGSFYALGVGRSATFFFDQDIAGPLTAVEVTFGRAGYYDETAEVYGGTLTDGGYDFSTLLGTVTNKANGNGIASLAFSGEYSALRFVDATQVPDGAASADGYDLDALNVSVAAVPLPASALLLLGGLGGLAGLRRRTG